MRSRCLSNVHCTGRIFRLCSAKSTWHSVVSFLTDDINVSDDYVNIKLGINFVFIHQWITEAYRMLVGMRAYVSLTWKLNLSPIQSNEHTTWNLHLENHIFVFFFFSFIGALFLPSTFFIYASLTRARACAPNAWFAIVRIVYKVLFANVLQVIQKDWWACSSQHFSCN